MRNLISNLTTKNAGCLILVTDNNDLHLTALDASGMYQGVALTPQHVKALARLLDASLCYLLDHEAPDPDPQAFDADTATAEASVRKTKLKFVFETIESIATDRNLVTWQHGNGTCKLYRTPRSHIDTDEDGNVDADLIGHAWDLIYINNSNVRLYGCRIDSAFGRADSLSTELLDQAIDYLASAPNPDLGAFDADIATTAIIPDGIYFLFPDGGGWEAAMIRNGKHVAGSSEPEAADHDKANDHWAGVSPSENDCPIEDGAMADAICQVVYGRNSYGIGVSMPAGDSPTRDSH